MIQPVAADVDYCCHWDLEFFACWGNAGNTVFGMISMKRSRLEEGDVQPVYFTVMSDLIDEFVDDPVYTDGATDNFHLCICRIFKNEVIGVEMRQFLSANAAGHLSKNSDLAHYHSNVGHAGIDLQLEYD